jgi:hypothetical protein
MLNYPFRRSCKEVASLVVTREDRPLNISEKLALRTHMWICKACPDFENQILTMRNAMHQWRNYSHDESAEATVDTAASPDDKKPK